MKTFCSSKGLVGLVVLLVVTLAAVPLAFAAGEGTFVIKTEAGDTYRFGGQLRMIPTSEVDWDFGLGTLPTGTNFKVHTNEAGSVARDYIRTEARLFFNAEDAEGVWDFYSALEFDSAVDQNEVDRRGRDYGLERLHASVAIPGFEQVRLHAGWDIYYQDAVDGGAGFIYGDDDPGFWITADFDSVEVQAGYHKRVEDNFLSRDESEFGTGSTSVTADDERDVYDVTFKLNLDEYNWVKAMGSFDVMKTRYALNKGADVKTYRLGLLYKGKIGILEPEAEFAYQGGTADDIILETGTAPAAGDDFDISAFAAYADLAFNLTDMFGFKVMPHIGFMYTSGDDDGSDDDLEGYTAVVNAQRFTPRFGGEDTIIGDSNTLLGTILYGYIPEFYGSMGGGLGSGGVSTGGLTNGAAGGRGDNPGMTLIGGGITISPVKYLEYRTNFMWFEWNEDFAVFNGITNVNVDSGTAGQQWSNSLRISLAEYVHIFGNATFFFPGEAIEDVTRDVFGNESDEVAQRYALALIWRF